MVPAGIIPRPGWTNGRRSGWTCHGPASPRLPRGDARRSGAPRPPGGRRHVVARPCAATGLAARVRHCSASNGNKRWATPSRTYVLPPGFGGVPAVALDSKGHLWVFQRADAGKPQLFKFDPNYKLVLQVGPDVIGYQDKAHGMAVDAEDNVWITAANGATVMKLSPEGKLLLTIGVSGRRGIGTRPRDSGCSGSR